MPRHTKTLKELESIWYARLKKEGFDDIEDTSKEMRLLKSWHSFKYQGIDPMIAETTRIYYEEALNLLKKYSFKNTSEKKIWELHCEGWTIREIEKKIKRYKRQMIHNIITLISKEIIKK